MKKNILLRTNLLVCLTIILGFVLTAILSYHANYSAALKNIEQVSTLTSEGIYYQMTNTFTKPVNISLTMANDSLLKAFLRQEPDRLSDEGYIAGIQEYLAAYRNKYGYDSVFLVSEATGRYYNFNGLDRVLTTDNPENVWYYTLRESDGDYNVVVDNDEVVGAENEITVFVNCKIKGDDGSILGIVGVGLRIDYLQSLLKGYQRDFGVDAYLVDGQGIIEISSDYSGYQRVSLQELGRFGEAARQRVLEWREEGTAQGFWDGEDIGTRQSYLVTRYLPELDWHLVVRQDTGALMKELYAQVGITVAIILTIIAVILLITTRVIRSCNRQIVALTQAVEQERRTVFERATEELFENIYELDITNNRPANQATEQYFESLGAPPGTPYDQALHIVAEKKMKAEFRQGYIDTFAPDHVLKALEEGRETLVYDAMTTDGAGAYYWIRITGRIVRWEGDGSIHMLTYRQNIDAEKRQERRMQRLAQTDEMTGLYTKSAAKRETERILKEADGRGYGLFLFDIDNFKQANDRYGHAFGDAAIVAFTRTIRAHFRETDLLGRVGGDEFMALIPVPDRAWAERKAAELAAALDQSYTVDGKTWHMTASIGVALSPEAGRDQETLSRNADAALYQTKARGRNGYTIYYEEEESRR